MKKIRVLILYFNNILDIVTFVYLSTLTFYFKSGKKVKDARIHDDYYKKIFVSEEHFMKNLQSYIKKHIFTFLFTNFLLCTILSYSLKRNIFDINVAPMTQKEIGNIK